MISVHVYGKLRRFAMNPDPISESVMEIEWEPEETLGHLIDRLGIPRSELGSNLFVDGKYADLESPVPDGARVGLFPDDMQLLYKWYFAPASPRSPDEEEAPTSTENEDEA